jgi:hypothetical protein
MEYQGEANSDDEQPPAPPSSPSRSGVGSDAGDVVFCGKKDPARTHGR